MEMIGWISRLFNHRIAPRCAHRAAGIAAAALFIVAAGAVVAQGVAPAAAPEANMSIPASYSSHSSVDLGGRISDVVGSSEMYNTFVNQHSGPRVLSQTFEMHALPGNKNTLVDDLNIFSSGFGGDAYTTARLTASKGKVYEFTSMFRRNRPYSNYDLLANPNIPGGQYIMNMSGGTPVPVQAWPQVNQSPVKYNTVRRMSDGNLTLMPFATYTVRLGYSHSTMSGPTLSPSYTLMGMKYNGLLQQNERNGSDDFLGAIDWKPTQQTKITFEMQANHYKSDTSYSLDPNGFYLQEADGTKAYLGNYTSLTPYTIAACTTNSMGSGYTNASNYSILTASGKGGVPVINPACAVVTSYMRSEPTRTWTPTETLRIQSTAVKNLTINGNVHYTRGRMDMLSYYENSQGLNGTVLSGISSGGNGTAQHAVIGSDFGIIWKVAPTFNIGDQITYSSTHEPSASIIPAPVTLNTPATAGNETINYAGTLTPGTGSLPHGINGTLTHNYFGQDYVINYLTLGWDATAKARFSFTYRHTNRNIGQGVPHQGPIPIVVSDPVSGTISINEDAGIFNAGLHLAKNWDLNGTVEAGYADNAFTTIAQRQFRQFRVHTLYRPNGWTTITGSFSDRERHNNTNNNQDVVSAGDANYNGPINHIDHNRVGSAGLVLVPSERYSIDLAYSYSDVYTATNICFSNGSAAATAVAPAVAGVATLTASGAPYLCAGNATWFARDFEDLPTQFVSATLSYNMTKKASSIIGYTLSNVNGSRFFNDARDVNGMTVSKYQSPYLKMSYALHPGLVFNFVFNYYGYGEPNTPSGAPLCTITPTSATITAANIVACSSLAVPTGMNEGSAGATAPRNFHANNISLGFHYDF
jgi:hypothetical protein